MIEMEFKGIAWVGNVYQKFETMCLEVEEVMCQDTVKFVENQVLTVGASVKKFYSEVMQDVLPPSSIDPVKVAAADLSLNLYADFSTHKKPKSITKKDNSKIQNRVVEDVNMKAAANQNCTLDSLSEQNAVVVSNKKSIGVIKRKSRRENNMPPEISRSFTTPSEDSNKVCCGMGDTHEVVNRMATELGSIAKGSDSGPVGNADNTESSNISAADRILFFESIAKKEGKLRHTFDQGKDDVSSAENNALVNDHLVAPKLCESDGTDSLMGSYITCDPKNCDSASEDCSSAKDDGDMNISESSYDIFEPREEPIQEFDKSNCVVVGREDLSVAASKEEKPRSYKKKIQKAFSSKRSARKQEYEQLAMQHHCLGTKPSQEIVNCLMPTSTLDESELPPPRRSESEWELL